MIFSCRALAACWCGVEVSHSLDGVLSRTRQRYLAHGHGSGTRREGALLVVSLDPPTHRPPNRTRPCGARASTTRRVQHRARQGHPIIPRDFYLLTYQRARTAPTSVRCREGSTHASSCGAQRRLTPFQVGVHPLRVGKHTASVYPAPATRGLPVLLANTPAGSPNRRGPHESVHFDSKILPVSLGRQFPLDFREENAIACSPTFIQPRSTRRDWQ
jgi:hypothetical protein